MRRQLRKNLLPSSTPRQNHTKTAAKPETRRTRDYILVIAAILSLLATFLTLVGYGLTLSILQFNLPHETLFGTTLDLLDLSLWMVLYFFESFFRMSLLGEAVGYLISLWWTIPVVFIVLFSCGLYFKYRSHVPYRPARKTNWINWFRFRREASVRTLAFQTGAYSLVVPATFILLSVFGAAATVCAALLLANAPMIGMNAGDRYIKEYVVGPEQCAPPRTRLERIKPGAKTEGTAKLANCVRIRNERGLCEQGRVVFATTGAIVLFEPATGHAFRVPTKDAVIDTLARLDGPATCTVPARNATATGTPAEASQAKETGTRG
ncbi:MULTISPECIES: hypothetical protein [Massilia]|uniref:RDD domain-containing protein n=1 Tax=Massilia haematophila TaxID=457923 RepID=A0ABV7PGW1_9BURK|nr:hypothetical protein [Massilia sp.]HBZ05355.1 hypothetical protein [Massilia sp.]